MKHVAATRVLNQVPVGDGWGKLAPVGIDYAARQIEVLDMDGSTFREPFFHETVALCRNQAAGRAHATVSIDAFLYSANHCGHSPDGFIFHTGRCGSTLLSNMLMASGAHLLFKEPEVISDLIAEWLSTSDFHARSEVETVLAAVLRSLIARTSAARYKVLKFAAWNVGMAEPLLHRFNETPAVFIYRHPAETVASLLSQRPAWYEIIRCPRCIQTCFFPTLREVAPDCPVSPVVLFAHAWRSAAEAALAALSPRLLLLEYTGLIAPGTATMERVLTHFGHAVEPSQLAAMVDVRKTYSKDPAGRAAFDPRGAHRRPPLSPADMDRVDEIAGAAWNRLQALRGQYSHAT